MEPLQPLWVCGRPPVGLWKASKPDPPGRDGAGRRGLAGQRAWGQLLPPGSDHLPPKVAGKSPSADGVCQHGLNGLGPCPHSASPGAAA